MVFAALCAVSVLVGGVYAVLAVRRAAPESARGPVAAVADPNLLATIQGGPHLVYLETDGDAFRQVAVAPLEPRGAAPYLTSLQCQRVHVAAGRGLCVGQDAYKGGAFIFDQSFQIRHTLAISGIPSRARVSPDGRYAAMTVFVLGHSYAEGAFSTRTVLIDMDSGASLAELEDFAVTRDGARFRSTDFNFWGVTFARDSNRFYATLGSGGKTYLLEGDVATRQARVLRENMECPSLSPDNTRLVFKKLIDRSAGRAVWRLHMLDLATMAETPLAETRGVDDQVEWLDDDRIVYTLPDAGPPATIRPDTWILALDSGDAPRRLVTRAFSPAAVR